MWQTLLGTCRLRNTPRYLAAPCTAFLATTYQWKLVFCCLLLVLQGQQSWLCPFTGCTGFPGGLILFQPPILWVFPLSWWGMLGSYSVTSKPFLTKNGLEEMQKIMFDSIQNRCSYICLNSPSFLTCLHKERLPSSPTLVMLCPFLLVTSQTHFILPLEMAAARENCFMLQHVCFHKQLHHWSHLVGTDKFRLSKMYFICFLSKSLVIVFN